MDELVSGEKRYLDSASYGIPIGLKLELEVTNIFFLVKVKGP